MYTSRCGITTPPFPQVRVCPQCARKLFRKKIEALRRQQQQQQREVERLLKKRQEGEEQADGDGARGSGKRTRKSDDTGGTGRENGHGNNSRGDFALGEDVEIEEDLGGHGLVRQAVAAAGGGSGGGGGGGNTSAAKKRSRPSRWGDKIDPSQAGAVATAAAAAAQSDGSIGSSVSGTGLGSGSGTAVGDEAMRQAWAGELERDRTAEDEMDDYLSSLLL